MPTQGAAASVGALIVGFASQQGVYRSRAAAMLWTACAMGLSTLVGGIAAPSPIALIVLSAAWGYACGLISSLGSAATVVGVNATVALIVFGHLHYAPHVVAYEALLVLAGGLIQTFLLVAVWPLRRFSVERHALAGVCRSLSSYACSLVRGQLEIPAAQPITTVREALADPQPFARRGEIAAFQSLLDEAERIRASLAALGADRARAADQQALDDLFEGCSGLLDALAVALDLAREPIDRDGDWAKLNDAAGRIGADAELALTTRRSVVALAGQLRAAWRIAQDPAASPAPQPKGGPRRPVAFPPLLDALETLRANFSIASPYGRLAIRLAATLAVATFLGAVLPTQHGYWIAMTAAILLKPDFSTTFARGTARIAGTLAGAFVATALAEHLHPGAETYVILCVLFAAIGYTFVNANYAIFTVGITTYVVFGLALVGQPEEHAAVDRVLATLLAAALVGIAVLVFPTWESGRTRAALVALLQANRRYLDAILRAYVDPAAYDAHAAAAAQTEAWAKRAAAVTSVDRMLGDPSRTRGIDANSALGILAASRRVGLACISLLVHFPHALHAARPGLEPLRQGLVAGLDAAIEALGEGRAPSSYSDLRDAYFAAEREAAAAGDRDAEMIFFEADALVDAVNTIAELARVTTASGRASSPSIPTP